MIFLYSATYENQTIFPMETTQATVIDNQTTSTANISTDISVTAITTNVSGSTTTTHQLDDFSDDKKHDNVSSINEPHFEYLTDNKLRKNYRYKIVR